MKKNKFCKCFLCQEEDDLMNSHIIPKFMAKKIREPPSRVYIVDHETKISQDTIKCYMLCKKCEKKFSILERRFSEDIVKKCDQNKIKYSNSVYLFLLSVIWRLMEYRIVTLKGEEKRRYELALTIKDSLRSFLHDGTPLPEQEIYMFILNSHKNYDFKILQSRKKIGSFTYSIYIRFCSKDIPMQDCQKDSATNYSLTYKSLISVDDFPFSNFDIYDDAHKMIFFFIVEEFIFCLKIKGEKLDFPDGSKINPVGGIWEDIQFPSIINDFLDRFGEKMTIGKECTDEDIAHITTCLKHKGIIQ